MCGIIAVLRRRSDRLPPASAEVVALLDGAAGELSSASESALAAVLDSMAGRVEGVDRLLRGTPGVLALLSDRGLDGLVDEQVGELWDLLEACEAKLDADSLDSQELEKINAGKIGKAHV